MKNQNLSATLQRETNRFADVFLLFAGGILALNGIGNLLESFGKSTTMDLHDPVLGISFRHLLLFAGFVELLTACLCLLTNKKTLSLAVVAWLAVNFTVYRIGLWTMGWHHPYAWLAGLMNDMDISPLMADGAMAAFMICLLTGSIRALWIKSRTTRKAEFLKMSCVLCDGHVEFPSHAIGQKISCPHCAKTITLLNPA